MSDPSVKPDEELAMTGGLLTIRKAPHDDVVKLLTELVTELRIENEDLKQMLMNQRSLMCGNSPAKLEEGNTDG